MRNFRAHFNLFDQKKETVDFDVSTLRISNDFKTHADYSEMGCFKDTVRSTSKRDFNANQASGG